MNTKHPFVIRLRLGSGIQRHSYYMRLNGEWDDNQRRADVAVFETTREAYDFGRAHYPRGWKPNNINVVRQYA